MCVCETHKYQKGRDYKYGSLFVLFLPRELYRESCKFRPPTTITDGGKWFHKLRLTEKCKVHSFDHFAKKEMNILA